MIACAAARSRRHAKRSVRAVPSFERHVSRTRTFWNQDDAISTSVSSKRWRGTEGRIDKRAARKKLRSSHLWAAQFAGKALRRRLQDDNNIVQYRSRVQEARYCSPVATLSPPFCRCIQCLLGFARSALSSARNPRTFGLLTSTSRSIVKSRS